MASVTAQNLMSAADAPVLCRRIRAARLGAAHISQEEAARRLGLSLKAYRAYELFREPSVRRLREIALAFGLDEEHFLASNGTENARSGHEHKLEAELQELKTRLERVERALAQLTTLVTGSTGR
jgi:transcriptional regulator with XRE-family HTH domain